MANVFICHRTADTREAELLANEIRSAGHHIWIDSDEIRIGDSIIKEMNRGLQGSTYLVLCYSSSGVTSPWTSQEWESFLTRQLNGEEIKILPVRLTGGDPPAILAQIKYADLVADWHTGTTQLLAAIK